MGYPLDLLYQPHGEVLNTVRVGPLWIWLVLARLRYFPKQADALWEPPNWTWDSVELPDPER